MASSYGHMDGQESGLKVIQGSISPVPNRVIPRARPLQRDQVGSSEVEIY